MHVRLARRSDFSVLRVFTAHCHIKVLAMVTMCTKMGGVLRMVYRALK